MSAGGEASAGRPAGIMPPHAHLVREKERLLFRGATACAFPRDRAVTHGRRSAESPGCSPDGHCWATPAPIGERVSAEMRDACDARGARVRAGARQRPRSLLPTLGIRSEADLCGWRAWMVGPPRPADGRTPKEEMHSERNGQAIEEWAMVVVCGGWRRSGKMCEEWNGGALEVRLRCGWWDDHGGNLAMISTSSDN